MYFLMKLSRYITGQLFLALFITLGFIPIGSAQVTPSGLGTEVNRSGNILNITGGKRGGNNLFHSFGQFNVQTGEIANFWTNPAIANILGRVNGGSASYINGLIQVLGGNSNLYLLNPAGIVFGANASLNVPAAFVATTANRVTFPGGVFDMNTQNVEGLTGNPLALMDFGNGRIEVNGSYLSAPGGIAFVAGRGGIQVENANITGNKGVHLISRPNGFVEIRTQQNILGFVVRQEELAKANSIYQLPELLTGEGTITVRNSGIAGDIIGLNSDAVTIESTNITGQTVQVGDTSVNSLVFDRNSIITSPGGIVELIAKNTEFAGKIDNPSGYVEVSGTEYLRFTGIVNAGTLLIDPTDLWIIENIYQVPSGVSVLTPTSLISQLQSGNVTLLATNEINIPFIGSPLDFTGVPANRSLTLQSGNTITINRGFINTNNLNFTANATNSINIGLASGDSLAVGGNLFVSAPIINIQANNINQIISGNNNVAVGFNNVVTGAGNTVFGPFNTVTGNNNSVTGSSNTVIGSNNTIGSLPSGSFSFGGITFQNSPPSLTPPPLLPPSSNPNSQSGLTGGSGSGTATQVEAEADILLRAQRQPLLGTVSTLTPAEIIFGFDQAFSNSFGLIGLERENSIGSVSELQTVLKQAAEQGRGRAALLYWWWREGQLTLGLILPRNPGEQTAFVKTVGVGQSEVQKTINEFVFTIKDPRQRHMQSYRPSAQKLYSWLVSPIEQILQENQIDTIILVPDEKFRTLPYRALWNGQEYFIERYRLVQIPSINLANFDLLSQGLSRNLVAMGASEFGGRDAPLPAVPVELQQVAQVNQGELRLNEQFTFADFVENWRKYPGRAIHIATHAEFTPARSYIQFWDRPVSFQDLRGQLNRTRSELVVLSACRTSIGDSYSELGFGGLALRMGAKRAIASLWYVEDEATFVLMNDFYRRLQGSQTIPIQSEALRQAQLAMIRGKSRIDNRQLVGEGYAIALPATLRQSDRNFTHPYHWAGFNMIGNPF